MQGQGLHFRTSGMLNDGTMMKELSENVRVLWFWSINLLVNLVYLYGVCVCEHLIKSCWGCVSLCMVSFLPLFVIILFSFSNI